MTYEYLTKLKEDIDNIKLFRKICVICGRNNFHGFMDIASYKYPQHPVIGGNLASLDKEIDTIIDNVIKHEIDLNSTIKLTIYCITCGSYKYALPISFTVRRCVQFNNATYYPRIIEYIKFDKYSINNYHDIKKSEIYFYDNYTFPKSIQTSYLEPDKFTSKQDFDKILLLL